MNSNSVIISKSLSSLPTKTLSSCSTRHSGSLAWIRCVLIYHFSDLPVFFAYTTLARTIFNLLPSLQTIQDNLRAEVLATGVSDPTSETLNALPYLTAVIVELLRVYPPVSQLINRVTTRDASLGGTIHIPKGTFVGWNAPGVQSDPKVWGPTARQFIPERWGTNPKEIMDKVRKETVKGHMISFNSHSRKCLGQGYALLEMKMVLFELVRRVKWTVSPDYELKITSVKAPHFFFF